MKVQMETVQFKADKKLLTFIEKKLGKLEQFFDRIIEATVYLRLENSGVVKDKVAEVILKVPGESLMAKSTCKTFETCIDEIVDMLKRQLVKYKEKMRDHHPNT